MEFTFTPLREEDESLFIRILESVDTHGRKEVSRRYGKDENDRNGLKGKWEPFHIRGFVNRLPAQGKNHLDILLVKSGIRKKQLKREGLAWISNMPSMDAIGYEPIEKVFLSIYDSWSLSRGAKPNKSVKNVKQRAVRDISLEFLLDFLEFCAGSKPYRPLLAFTKENNKDEMDARIADIRSYIHQVSVELYSLPAPSAEMQSATLVNGASNSGLHSEENQYKYVAPPVEKNIWVPSVERRFSLAGCFGVLQSRDARSIISGPDIDDENFKSLIISQHRLGLEDAINSLRESFKKWNSIYLMGGTDNVRKMKFEANSSFLDIRAKFIFVSMELQSKSKSIDRSLIRNFIEIVIVGEHVFDLCFSANERIDFYMQALHAAKIIGDSIESRICFSLGNVFKDIADFNNALYFYGLCQANAKAINDWEWLCRCYSNIAHILAMQGDTKGSGFYVNAARQSLANFSADISTRIKICLPRWEAINYLSSGNFKLAVDACNRAIDLAGDANALRLINITNVAMGSALIKMDKAETACDLLSKCALNARLIGDLKTAMDAYRNLGEIYFSMNEKDLCYEAYRSLFELSERYGHTNFATHARNSLIKVEMLK